MRTSSPLLPALTSISVYVAYLVFQFWSHTYLYGDELNKRSAKLSTVIREKRQRHRERVCTSLHSASFHNHNAPTQLAPSLGPELSSSASATMLIPPRRPFVASESSLSLPNSDETSAVQRTDICSSRSTGMEKSPSLSPGILHLNPQSTVRIVPHGPVPGGIPMAHAMTRESTMDSGITYTEDMMFCSSCERQEPSQEIIVVPTQHSPKEPQLSWFVTILTMILVTGVSLHVLWLNFR